MLSNRPLRYQALAAYLSRQDEREVLVTFAEVEAIIGASLPLMAVYNKTWWTNPTLMHVRMWRERGWRADLNRASRQILFIRDADEFHADA